MKIKLLAILYCGVLFSPFVLFADGNTDKIKPEPSLQERDTRLPPLLPGEEVKAGSKTVKIWSTSGPVSVGKAPEPWKSEDSEAKELLENGRVIVDQRSRDVETKSFQPQ